MCDMNECEHTIDALTALKRCKDVGFFNCSSPRSFTNVTAPLICRVHTVLDSSVDVIASYKENSKIDMRTSSDLAARGSLIATPTSRRALPYIFLASNRNNGDLRPLLSDARANACVAWWSIESDLALTYMGPRTST